MRRALLISLVACLVTIHQARLIDRCALAKLLQQEDMDGFEGYSLSDCQLLFQLLFLEALWQRGGRMPLRFQL